MVVLDELRRQAHGPELVRAKCLHEKAARVSQYLWNNHHNLIQVAGFYLQRHLTVIPFGGM
jgi:hypothetical protein